MMTRKQHIRYGLLFALVLTGAGLWYATRPDEAELPIEKLMGPTPAVWGIRQQAIPTIRVADIVGWKDGEKPVAAKGLAVNEFARDLDHPRWLAQLPNGDVLVAESTQPARKSAGVADRIASAVMKKANGTDKSADRIMLLRDGDGDGKAETRSVFMQGEANGLRSPFGMALIGNKFFVANTHELREYVYEPGAMKIEGKGKLRMNLPAGTPNNHWARNVIAAPDGKHLFVTIGSHGNIGEEGGDFMSYYQNKPERALIRRYDVASGKSEIWAYGLRNPNGLAYNPQSGTLWVTVNERDMLGSDGPSDYLATVDFGTFYGWPFYFWGGLQDPRVQQVRPDLRQYTKRPEYALGPHVAALGLGFAQGPQLGDDYARGAFVALHGSWNRSPPSGYKVIYIPFNEVGHATKGAKPVDLLTGFLTDDQRSVRGRPAGLIVAKDGAVMVADDAGNRIWRVTKG